jgi:hypothetical protein
VIPQTSIESDSSTPEYVTRQVVELLDVRDVDGLMELYEPDAVFADLEVVSKGLTDIRAAHEQFLDLGLSLTPIDSVPSKPMTSRWSTGPGLFVARMGRPLKASVPRFFADRPMGAGNSSLTTRTERPWSAFSEFEPDFEHSTMS